jgi:hypothetical protein
MKLLVFVHKREERKLFIAHVKFFGNLTVFRDVKIR